jgi:hypothetical protein
MRQLKTGEQLKYDLIKQKTEHLNDNAVNAIKSMFSKTEYNKGFERKLDKAVLMFKAYKRKN